MKSLDFLYDNIKNKDRISFITKKSKEKSVSASITLTVFLMTIMGLNAFFIGLAFYMVLSYVLACYDLTKLYNVEQRFAQVVDEAERLKKISECGKVIARMEDTDIFEYVSFEAPVVTNTDTFCFKTFTGYFIGRKLDKHYLYLNREIFVEVNGNFYSIEKK